MTIYIVTTLEKFITRAEYRVEADNKKEAIEKVRSGDVDYRWHDHLGYDDEFIDVEIVEEVYEPPSD
jgi:hypothetical protein